MAETKAAEFTSLFQTSVSESLDDKDLFARIIAAYVSNNKVSPDELPKIMRQVRDFLASIDRAKQPKAQAPMLLASAPAVPIQESVQADFIICLEDGAKCKILKRYIKTRYGLSPEQYRLRWKLPESYPMVAPAISQSRSEAAKKMSLGGAKARRRANG